MKNNYSSLPYKLFNTVEMRPKYEKLNMLKKALGLGEANEVYEDLIFDFISRHNHHEFYLMEYIINKVIYIPREIKFQNLLLVSLYEKPEEYKKQYKTIKKMYETRPVFKNFADSIKEDLYLQDNDNRKLFNYQVYELCHKYINNERILEPIDVHLNLHFVQKWISEQNKLKLEPFTEVENQIIYYLANGYSVYEIAKANVIKEEKDKNFLNMIVYEILPAKCHVETINQVMATHCCQHPNPAKVDPYYQASKRN